MVGAQCPCRRAWSSALLLLLSLLCLGMALVNAQPQAATPHCKLTILGGDGNHTTLGDDGELIILGYDGKLKQASIACTGTPTAVVSLNSTHLENFMSNFAGVNLVTSCESKVTEGAPCLLTICSGSLVLWDSNLSWVRGSSIESFNSLLCMVHDSRLEVYNSTFANNQVRPLMAADQASLALHDSIVSMNRAGRGSGGGLLLQGNASAVVGGSRFFKNCVWEVGGGGLAARDSSKLTVTNSSLNNNSADYGAGLAAEGNASVMLTANSSVDNNHCMSKGGGISVTGNASVVIADSSSVSNNHAAWDGAGVAASGHARVTLVGGSVLSSNTANEAGGMRVSGDAVVTIIGSTISGNTAPIGNGGGIYVEDDALVTITDGVVSGNTAVNSGGGGVFATGTSKVLIANSCVYDNSAKSICGGLAACDKAAMNITTGSSVYNNTSDFGGGICAIGNGTHGKVVVVIMDNTSVYSNWAARGAGGGIVIGSGTALTITGSIVANNTCIGGWGGGLAAGFATNSVNFGAMGQTKAQELSEDSEDSDSEFVQVEYSGYSASGLSTGDDVVDEVLINNSSFLNNTSQKGAGGGLAAASHSIVSVTGGTLFSNNSVVEGSGGAVMLINSATFAADGSVVFADNRVPAGFVGSTIVAFENSSVELPSHGSLTKCSGGVYLSRTPCGVGEFLQHDVCVCCPPHTVSFANTTCTPCPANAQCLGANIVKPLPGFWSSAPTSIQMHRCPLFRTACEYVDESHMCKPGYRGTLCGDCQLPEYGMLSPMRCGRCMRPPVQLGLYVFLSSLTTSFVTYTVHATWQENLRGDRAVLITDNIKVLVLFLQYLVIIGSVSVPWPLSDMQQWLQALGIAVTMGSGQALSLDCWLYYYVGISVLPIAIQRLLVYFLAPAFVLVVVMALQWLWWALLRWLVPLFMQSRRGASSATQSSRQGPWVLLRKLPVTVLVLVFYAFPTLVRASLSFFACLAVDVPLAGLADVPVGATATLTHYWGYWVSAIDQQCFAGYHLRWAIGLGVPSVLLWCVAVPVATGVGLYLYRSRADSDSFREKFGFLYRTYRPECMWWEAVWAARTVLLTVISVFSFPMQRYYSVLSLLLVFWASAAVQIAFQPYAEPTLHRLHLVSTSCLAATTLGALAMFAYDIQESTAYALRIAIMVLVFVVNLVFVVWCFLKLAPALKATVAAAFATAKEGGLHGVRSAFAYMGYPVSAAQPAALVVDSRAGQHGEESKDPSTMSPAERV